MTFMLLCFFETVDPSNANTQETRPGKVRGANLPQEYELTRFVQNIENPHPSWNASTPACDWEHVTCDEELHVIWINWNGMNMKGSLQWNYLCHTVLEFRAWLNQLRGNVLLGALPSQIVRFDLSTNGFSGELDWSHLPGEMIDLFFSDNKFKGCVDFKHLPLSLKVLQVQYNQFSGDLDLTRLPRLMTHVNLSQNCFTGPLDLQHLPSSLQILNCHRNQFSGLVMFNRLPISLSTLNLEANAELCGTAEKLTLPIALKNLGVGGTKISSNFTPKID